MYYKQLFTLFSACLFFSCQERDDINLPAITKLSIQNQSVLVNEQVKPINAYAYKNNRLTKKIENIQLQPDAQFPVDLAPGEADRLIIIAGNTSPHLQYAINDLTEIKTETSASVDFVSTFPQLFFTGEKELIKLNNTIADIALTRSIASLDFRLGTTLPVQIDSCIVDNLADKTNIFSDKVTPPYDLQYRSMRIASSAFSNFNNYLEGALYMYESHGKAPKVTIYAKINGVKNKLSLTLPDNIERNKRYEIVINSNGAVTFTNLNVLPWSDGGSTVAKPDSFTPKIDLSNSTFPQGVSVGSNLDTLFLAPHFEGKFILGINAPVETETKIESTHIQVKPLSQTKESYLGNRFELDVRRSDINKPDMILSLFVKSKSESQFYDKQIVLVKRGYRTRFDHATAHFSENKATYSDYIDGQIATISSSNPHKIQSITTQSEDEQFNWLKITEVNRSKILDGAFKPNDQGATGQMQSSTITVTYQDGVVENFTFTRKRQAIPVTKLGGLYWAKYNMRGNSKIYQDQINFTKDVDDLWEHLKNCSDQDFVYYSGAQYKGQSTDAMYYRNINGHLLLDKYSEVAPAHINASAPEMHCPPGYRIPSQDEMAKIVGTHLTMNLPAPGTSNQYTTPSNNIRYRIDRHRRNSLTIDGVTLHNIDHIKLTDINSNESIVLMGLGHQFSDTNTEFYRWIFGVVGSGSQRYYEINNTSNKLGMAEHNNSKTRIIRCVKSPVNYIIQ